MTARRLALLALSAALAIAYGVFGSSLYEGAPPYPLPALFKASSIVILALIAWTAGALAGMVVERDVSRLERAPLGAHAGRRPAVQPANAGAQMPARTPAVQTMLLPAGLLFGATGDALLAWSEDTFLAGAVAFLIGHLFYIALFLRAGIGARAFGKPPRVIAIIAVVALSIAMTVRLVPGESPLFIPLGLYTVVLTVMTMTSFTLPASRWLAMAGAVLFLISDGFVAANMFHPIADPTLAYWSSFAGWMIYWAGQAAICVGALGLHKAK